MRTYIAVNEVLLQRLQSAGLLELTELAPLKSFGATELWLANQDETDPEVLADLLAQECAQSTDDPFIIVAEIPAQVGSQYLGQVVPTANLQKSMVAAFFVKDQSGELSWYGPTELLTLLESGA
ncbi:MAG: hypothetical protein KGQ38_00080 [Actinomycetales bacterium]|nr:hypothetical protein [Actinomycetales bacterium]